MKCVTHDWIRTKRDGVVIKVECSACGHTPYEMLMAQEVRDASRQSTDEQSAREVRRQEG